MDLSRQVFEALEVLLAGFAAAEGRDGTSALRAALEQADEQVSTGLLAVLLWLVFLLYCEDRGLVPTERSRLPESNGILGLFDALQSDFVDHPDTMRRSFGAYPRLVSLFRAVFPGVSRRDLTSPARRGELFNPDLYPFLEGRGPERGEAIAVTEAQPTTKLPSIDDFTVHSVLEKLLYLGGRRLSYKTLDVEQIGSVYEALMGFAVKRIEGGAVRIRIDRRKGAPRVWVDASALLAVPANQRERWLEDELGFDRSVAARIGEATRNTTSLDEALAAMDPVSGRTPERAGAGALVIQPGPERRRTSSHYTPRELTEPIVQRTLEPLIKAMGDAPSSEELLRLVVCDPAAGSGAFLIAACRFLADHVVAAWTQEGRIAALTGAHGDIVSHARRLVAQRCLYGVDKNPHATELAKLSLWLVTRARDEPFTFVDHTLRHGDSLVGLSSEQLRAFHWNAGTQVELPARLVSEVLDQAAGIRKKLLDRAGVGTVTAQREKERLLRDAEETLDRARLIGDLVIGAFFGQKNDKDREKERDRRLQRVEQWLAAEQRGDTAIAKDALVELHAMQAELRREQAPFHWVIEFPEVFHAERPDPRAGSRANGATFVDAFVGNPPFLGGSAISSAFGDGYRDWLLALHEHAHGNSDLVAHFFRRAAVLVGQRGTIGLIATNTIGQGDTRATGLRHLLARGLRIYRANANLPWPGDASVTVSVIHAAVGLALPGAVLDGRRVGSISSRLRATPERPDPVGLATNASLSFNGSKIYGLGFVLEPSERDALVARNARNAERTFPYLGGEELNTSPTQDFNRYVINFGDMRLEQAAEWSDLLSIVESRVKPGRDVRDHNAIAQRQKRYWWLYRSDVPELRAATVGLGRCLVTARISKHLMLSFQPTDRIFSEQVYVFALDGATAFAVLQSRVHEPWVRLLSSSLEERLRYAASDCFETFPFPEPDPRAALPGLEIAGAELHEARARFMIETGQGLTKTYNALRDPGCEDPRVLALRALHEATDRAVLAAYGWNDVATPPYCPTTDAERAAVRAFEDEVIDRLFVRNAERAAHESQAAAAMPAPGKAGRSRAKKPTDEAAGPA